MYLKKDNGRINTEAWDQTIWGINISGHLIDYLEELETSQLRIGNFHAG